MMIGKNDFASARDVTNKAIAIDVNLVVVNQVCSLTKNRNFCTGILNSNPSPSLDVLGNIISNEIQISATRTLNVIRLNLLPKASTAQKGHLTYCQGRYESSLFDNGRIIPKYAANDYNGAKKMALIAENYGTQCENSFKSPPAGASPLTKENHELSDLFDIFVAICTLLLHHHL
ncbi:Pectinesterase inhibitor domain [Macleaya cordata]|uniref:Pectinesterase inhibitor domain n=1 Tax=Macleaya cordata TaxID=56857 RepID=A0A200QJK8_MACCD|nr:Pectinesterase inhibitor domain [Macleaya cordata]